MHQEFKKVIYNRTPNSDDENPELEPELIAVGRLRVNYEAPAVKIKIIAKDEKTALVDEDIRSKFGYQEDYERGIAFFDVFEWSYKKCTFSLQFGKSESLDEFLKFVEQNLTKPDSDLIRAIREAKNERVKARVLVPVTREDVTKGNDGDDDLDELFHVEQELRHEAAVPVQMELPSNYEDVPYEPEKPLHEPEAPQSQDEEIFYEAQPTHHREEAFQSEPTLAHDEEIPPYEPETLLHHEHEISDSQEPALYRDYDFEGGDFTPLLTEERHNIAHLEVKERHYEPFPEEHPKTPTEVKLLPPSDENDDVISSPPPSESDEGTHVGILRSDSFETGSSASYVIIKSRDGHYEDSD